VARRVQGAGEGLSSPKAARSTLHPGEGGEGSRGGAPRSSTGLRPCCWAMAMSCPPRLSLLMRLLPSATFQGDIPPQGEGTAAASRSGSLSSGSAAGAWRPGPAPATVAREQKASSSPALRNRASLAGGAPKKFMA